MFCVISFQPKSRAGRRFARKPPIAGSTETNRRDLVKTNCPLSHLFPPLPLPRKYAWYPKSLWQTVQGQLSAAGLRLPKMGNMRAKLLHNVFGRRVPCAPGKRPVREHRAVLADHSACQTSMVLREAEEVRRTLSTQLCGLYCTIIYSTFQNQCSTVVCEKHYE